MTIFFKAYRYIQSLITKHQYIAPTFHYWYADEIATCLSIINICCGYFYVRPRHPVTRALLVLFTLLSFLSLFILHVPSCSVSEDAANLATFLNSTTHNCYDNVGVYHNETDLPVDRLVSKFGYVIRRSDEIHPGALKIGTQNFFYPTIGSSFNYVRYLLISFSSAYPTIAYVLSRIIIAHPICFHVFMVTLLSLPSLLVFRG